MRLNISDFPRFFNQTGYEILAYSMMEEYPLLIGSEQNDTKLLGSRLE